MSTSIAPDATQAADPTLAEAFGELANAIVEGEEDSEQETTSPAPSDSPAPAPAEEPKAAPPAPEAPKPDAATQPTEEAKPDAPAPDAPKEPTPAELLATQQPLTYVVDGATRTFDGAFVIPGRGAIIPNEVLPRLQDRLNQADRLVAQNESLYQTAQEYQKLGGRDGITEMMTQRALLDKVGALLINTLNNPDVLMRLATDPREREQLLRDVNLTAREAQYTAQNEFREQFARDATAHQTVIDQQQVAHTAINNAVALLATQHVPGMTPEDIAAVRTNALAVANAIVHPANPEEARIAGVQPGEMVINSPVILQWLTERHQMRQALQASAQAQAKLQAENAARLAAAAPTPAAAPAAARPVVAKPAPPAPKKLDDMSYGELTRAMRSGRIFDLIPDPDESDE